MAIFAFERIQNATFPHVWTHLATRTRFHSSPAIRRTEAKTSDARFLGLQYSGVHMRVANAIRYDDIKWKERTDACDPVDASSCVHDFVDNCPHSS